MKPKTIILGIVFALLIVILFNNKEESVFWLFGEIRTSKLFILGTFFVLGMATGGIIFRRKSRHPKEYSVSIQGARDAAEEEEFEAEDQLSAEDRKFLGRD